MLGLASPIPGSPPQGAASPQSAAGPPSRLRSPTEESSLEDEPSGASLITVPRQGREPSSTEDHVVETIDVDELEEKIKGLARIRQVLILTRSPRMIAKNPRRKSLMQALPDGGSWEIRSQEVLRPIHWQKGTIRRRGEKMQIHLDGIQIHLDGIRRSSTQLRQVTEIEMTGTI